MVLQVIIYTLITIIIAAITYIYFKLIHPEKRVHDALRAQGIKGEPFVPLIGQLPAVLKYLNNDALMLYPEELVRKYGNTYLISFGTLTFLMTSEPGILAEVLGRNSAQHYTKPSDLRTILTPILGSNSLLIVEGSEHERARRMINPAFHHVSLKSMISIITDRTAKAIESMIFEQQKTKSADLQVLFNALTLSIIASSAFGADFETNANAKDVLCRVFTEVLSATEYRSMRMINRIPFLSRLPFWRKNILDSGTRQIAQFINQIIADRRRGKSTSMCSGADLLDLLLSAVDNDGQPFTDQEIKEESLTFVLAGSETTGNLMVWIYYILMTHSDVLQACREEVDRILPKGIQPTNEHLSELVVCEAVIHETLRLYPPVPFLSRQCVHEHTLNIDQQLRIPKGVSIGVDNYALHHRSDLWPRPLEFDYTRWMRDPKTGLKPKLPHPFAYLPFAAGSRNCIGQNFALLEAKIMLAMFVQRCNFEMVPGQKIVPDVKLTMRPKYGLLANITKRQI